jgi:hypothetical protein
MPKIIGKDSVENAVRRIYPTLPRRFSLICLHATVAREINRPYVFLDTCRRKLFLLRENGDINFKNVSKSKSIYEKVN